MKKTIQLLAFLGLLGVSQGVFAAGNRTYWNRTPFDITFTAYYHGTSLVDDIEVKGEMSDWGLGTKRNFNEGWWRMDYLRIQVAHKVEGFKILEENRADVIEPGEANVIEIHGGLAENKPGHPGLAPYANTDDYFDPTRIVWIKIYADGVPIYYAERDSYGRGNTWSKSKGNVD